MTSPSVFTQMLRGERPARFVWQDERVVASLSDRPIQPGHVLVFPREQVDHWIDLSPDLLAHLMQVAQTIGRALQQAFRPVKVGMVIAGVEVRHVHIHLAPIGSVHDLDFSKQEPGDPARLDADAERIRAALGGLGQG